MISGRSLTRLGEKILDVEQRPTDLGYSSLQVPPRETPLCCPVEIGEVLVSDDPLSGFEVLQLEQRNAAEIKVEL